MSESVRDVVARIKERAWQGGIGRWLAPEMDALEAALAREQSRRFTRFTDEERAAFDVALDCMTLADWITDELPRAEAAATIRAMLAAEAHDG